MAAGSTPALLRLCLDLNVWVADFLGTRRGRRGGSSPWLADAVRSGSCQAGPLQLVVSLGMLDRLALVLMREFQVEADAAETLARAIGSVASFGPAGDHPHAVVGGGVYPLRDEEDRHVLEVAVAGVRGSCRWRPSGVCKEAKRSFGLLLLAVPLLPGPQIAGGSSRT